MTLQRIVSSLVGIVVLGMVTLPIPHVHADPSSTGTSGTISGRVVSGATSTPPSGPHTIRLDGYRQATALVTRETSTSSDGSFEFPHVEAGPEFVYLVSVEHGGIRYSSDILLLEPGGQTSVDLEVFAATDKNPGISFRTLTRLLRAQSADVVSVVQIAEVFVPGNRAFTPSAQDMPPALRFAVPEGAFGLQPIGGFSIDDIVIGGPGFAIFSGLRPGINTIIFGYQLALDNGFTAFDWKPSLSADTVIFLVEIGPLKAEVQNLEPRGESSFGGTSVLRWQTDQVAAGTNLDVQIEHTTVPRLIRLFRATTTDRWAIGATIAAVILGLSLIVWRRNWRVSDSIDPLAEANRLLAELRTSGTSPANSSHRVAVQTELFTLLEKHPEIIGDLRRGQAHGADPNKTLAPQGPDA